MGVVEQERRNLESAATSTTPRKARVLPVTDGSRTSGQPPAPPEIDTSVPHSARIWNYWLGGKDNYPVDREAGDQFGAVFPGSSTSPEPPGSFSFVPSAFWPVRWKSASSLTSAPACLRLRTLMRSPSGSPRNLVSSMSTTTPWY